MRLVSDLQVLMYLLMLANIFLSIAANLRVLKAQVRILRSK